MSWLVDAARDFLVAKSPTDGRRAAGRDHEQGFCDVSVTRPLCAHQLATFAHAQCLALLQSLLDEELNTHGGKSSAVGTWLRTRMEEEKAHG